MERTQRLFWLVAGCLTVGTVGFSLFLAFYGGAIMKWFVDWKESRTRRLRKRRVERRVAVPARQSRGQSFEVLDATRSQ